jgi:predicted ArsR family transcriptional regulator
VKFAEQLVESVVGTRVRVVRSLLEDGPASAAVLAERLGLTPAAVRRHLDVLVAEGQVEARERSPYGPDPRRGRGRPARIYSLTPGGHQSFPQAYDDLASKALRYLAEVGGSEAVGVFARAKVADFEDRHRAAIAAVEPEQRAQALAEALSADGYAASVDPSPGGGAQICQHHCPVAHVAAEFPQLCEAETEVFARLLGRHVQRIATIGQGAHVCTTVVPPVPGAATSGQSVPHLSVPHPSVPRTSDVSIEPFQPVPSERTTS